MNTGKWIAPLALLLLFFSAQPLWAWKRRKKQRHPTPPPIEKNIAAQSAAQEKENQSSPPTTTEEEFKNAYVLLTQADAARDNQRFSLSMELYKRALDAYREFSEKYPDWQPGVVSFRINYCSSQLKSIVEDIKSGKIILLGKHVNSDSRTQPLSHSSPTDSDTISVAEAVARASILISRKDPTAARDILLPALRKDPDNAAVRILIGIAQCQARKFPDAVFLMENMVEDLPDNTDARLVLATAYFGLGRMDDAIEQLKKALEINPHIPEAHYDLARLLLAAVPPNHEQAALHYRKAVSLGIKPDPELEKIFSVKPVKSKKTISGTPSTSKK